MDIQQSAETKRKFWGKMIWISAISLVLAICAGVAVPVIGMINAFSTLSTAGSADPAELAGNISTALIGALVSIPFALASLVLFIVAIIRHRKFSNPSQAG
jgi:uncharacterized membrane protein YhaH (DUF805 family)